MNKIDIKEKLFLIIIFIISVFYLYLVTVAEGPINSDEISGIIIGNDIFTQGNFFLRGWNLTTSITTIQLLFASIICKIFGETYTTLYLISALNYSILVNIIIFIIFKNIKKNGVRRYIVSCIVLLLILIPRSHSIMNVCTHTLLYAVCIMVIYVTYLLYCKKASIYAYLITGCLVGAIASLNITMLYYAIIPIIFIGVVCLWLKIGDTRQNIYFIFCGIIEIILSKLLYYMWIIMRGVEFIPGTPDVFVTQDNVVNNIVQGISNILFEFGIDLWGENLVSLATLKAAVGMIIMYIVFKEICEVKNLEDNKKVLVICFLSFSIINIMAYIFSSIAGYSQSTHLMEPFGIFLCAAFGICIGNVESWFTKNKERCISFLLILCIFFILNTSQLSFTQEPSKTQNVTNFLLEKGYTKGFSTYWESYTIMFDSHLEITIAPISVDYSNAKYPEGIVGGWQWATKDEWLQQEGEFVLFNKDNSFGIHADKIIEELGQPTQYLEIDDFGILLYENGVKLKYIYL